MKMVKSLLLGSAAGLVAVAGAQAADLPVKAKPVEYVKICSIYGAGFFYIPGTDTCIKIGGWVRAEDGLQRGRQPHATTTQVAAAVTTASTLPTRSARSRLVMSLDVRTQTEYGTLRAYTRAGFQRTTNEDRARHATTSSARSSSSPASRSAGRSPTSTSSAARHATRGYIGGTGSTGAGGTQRVRLHGHVRQRLHRHDLARRRHAAPQRDLGCRAPMRSRSARCRARASRRGPATTLAAGGQRLHRRLRGRVRFRTSSARCASTRLGARRRSPAPCTRSRRLLRQQQHGSQRVVGPGGYTGLAPDDKWGYAVDGRHRAQPAVGQGRPVLGRRCVHGGARRPTPAGTTNGQYTTSSASTARNVAAAWALDAVFANAIGPVTLSTGATGASA